MNASRKAERILETTGPRFPLALGVSLLIAAIALLACLEWAPYASARGVAEKAGGTGGTDAGAYIVVFRDGVSLASRLEAEEERGVEVDQTYRHVFKGFAADLDPEDVKRLEKDQRVLMVEADGEVTIQSNQPQDRNTLSWGLDRIDQRALPFNSRLVTGNNGFGVETYIIDTGVRLDHTQFSGRVSPEGYSAFGGSWNDCHGHGTHVAGTVAGSSYGVAPAARVTAVRVLDCDGSGTDSTVIAGIDWMIADHKAGEPAVGNMSLGGSRTEALNAAVERAVADGITMAVAAGNESSDACDVSPASAPSAVTVGSTTRRDEMSGFSNVGRCVDIFAPGSDIVSASYRSPNAVETLSGTSMASPHVAGAAALLLSAQPSMSPASVTEGLIDSSTPGAITSLQGCSMNRLLHIGSGPDLPGPDAPSRPPLDDFANAQVLSGLSGTSGTSTCATKEAGEPSHGPLSAASIWYRWTAPSSGTLTLTTSGSSFDTVLAVYTGSSVDRLTQRAQDDDSGGSFTSRLSLPVTAGTTYSIAIDGFLGQSGPTQISGSFSSGGGGDPGDPGDPEEPGRPANDDFVDRQSLPPSVQASGSNTGATAESGEPGHAQSQARASIWYRLTAGSTGTLTINTNGSSFDTVLAVYTGSSVGSLNRLAQDDDSGDGLASQVSIAATAGTTYSIAVDGYGGATGTTRVLASLSGGGGNPGEPGPPPPTDPDRPVNDDFVDAARVNSWQNAINTSNEGATAEAGEPGHSSWQDDPPNGSIWYRWTAPNNGILRIDTTSTWGLDIAVYTGSSVDSLNRIEAGWRDLTLPVRRGAEYRIVFDQHYPGSVSDIEITGSFTAAPPNDDFDDARVIESWSSPVTGTNVAATSEPGEPGHEDTVDDSGEPVASVWYRWTAPSNGRLTLSTDGSSISSPRLAVYTGDSVDSLRRVRTSWDALVVRRGVQYSIAIDHWNRNRAGQLRLSGSLVRASANDAFSDATPIDLGMERVSARTGGSTIEPDEPPHMEGNLERDWNGSIWYRWTAPNDMSVRFWMSADMPEIAVYTGSSVGSLQRVPVRGYSFERTFQARAGVTYSMAIEHYDTEDDERFWVKLRRDLKRPTFITTPVKRQGGVTRSKTARFTLGGDPGAQFECKRKGQSSWSKCGRKVTLRNLRSGTHVLWIRQRHGVSTSHPWVWEWEVKPRRG